MNESVGYTVTINIIITFIIIVFAFISNVLIYYKSNRVGNLITDSIEKYSGFNELARNEIDIKLEGIGYNKININCGNISGCTVIDAELTKNKGYCVYECEAKEKYYFYKIKTNMMINIPIINELLNASVFSSTGNLYDFQDGISEPESSYTTIVGDTE